MRGVLQLARRYLLVLAILAGVAGYFIGLLTAPTLHPHEDVPGWFQPYFIAMTAIIAAFGAVLILQVNFAELELSSRNGVVVYLEMTLGLIAGIAGATTIPSRGWYPQLLAFSDLGAAAAVIATLVCGIKKLGADARRTGQAWGAKIRGRKPPTASTS